MIDDLIKAAVTPVVPICVPHRYGGAEDTFTTFVYTEIPTDYGDNRPHAVRYLVTIHLYLPLSVEPNAIKRALRRAIAAEEAFTVPTIEDATDDKEQHYALEFEAVDGGGLDGEL